MYNFFSLKFFPNFWFNARKKIQQKTFWKVFPENRHLHFMQIISLRQLHEMLKPIFWKKYRKTTSICHLLILSREWKYERKKERKKEREKEGKMLSYNGVNIHLQEAPLHPAWISKFLTHISTSAQNIHQIWTRFLRMFLCIILKSHI